MFLTVLHAERGKEVDTAVLRAMGAQSRGPDPSFMLSQHLLKETAIPTRVVGGREHLRQFPNEQTEPQQVQLHIQCCPAVNGEGGAQFYLTSVSSANYPMGF